MSVIGYPTIKFYNPDLILDVIVTSLTADATAASATFTVANIVGIGVGDYLLIGEFGQETAEIVRVHASTAPSSGTITLAANTTYAHSRSEQVHRIDRNQVEFSRATTLTGSKTVLATNSITPDDLYTLYTDTTNTTGFGFARAVNQADSTYSNYSESYPYAGYSEQSLKKIFDSVLTDMGLVDDNGQPLWTNKISREAAYQAVVDCQDMIARRRYRWSYLENFDVVFSEIATGQDVYDLPTQIAKENGNAMILSLRMGRNEPLVYIDKRKMNERREDVAKTTLGAAITGTGNTTITLTDSSDFDDAGNIDVVSDDGETIDSIAYTANDRSTNILSGVTGIAATVSIGANVWQGGDFGQPVEYTVFENTVTLDPIPDETWEGYNLTGDIYEKPTVVNDLADEAQFPATVIKPYVKYKLDLLRFDGDESKAAGSYARYQERLDEIERAENNGQRFSFKPGQIPESTTNQRNRGAWWETNRN